MQSFTAPVLMAFVAFLLILTYASPNVPALLCSWLLGHIGAKGLLACVFCALYGAAPVAGRCISAPDAEPLPSPPPSPSPSTVEAPLSPRSSHRLGNTPADHAPGRYARSRTHHTEHLEFKHSNPPLGCGDRAKRKDKATRNRAAEKLSRAKTKPPKERRPRPEAELPIQPAFIPTHAMTIPILPVREVSRSRSPPPPPPPPPPPTIQGQEVPLIVTPTLPPQPPAAIRPPRSLRRHALTRSWLSRSHHGGYSRVRAKERVQEYAVVEPGAKEVPTQVEVPLSPMELLPTPDLTYDDDSGSSDDDEISCLLDRLALNDDDRMDWSPLTPNPMNICTSPLPDDYFCPSTYQVRLTGKFAKLGIDDPSYLGDAMDVDPDPYAMVLC